MATLSWKIPFKKILNHKNGDKTDNRLANLEVVTYGQNNQHAVDNGFNVMDSKRKKAISVRLLGENSSNATLTNKQVSKIKRFLRAGYTHSRIAEHYNVGRHVITGISNGKHYANVK